MPESGRMVASKLGSTRRRYHRRLRSRIIISFVLLGFCLTTLFALATNWARIRVENQLVEDMMNRNLDASWQRYVESDGAEVIAEVQQLRAFLFKPDHLDILRRDFPEWEHLPEGIHTLRGNDTDNNEAFAYKVGVRKTSQAWFFIAYDMRSVLRSEQQLKRTLMLSVLIFTGLSWLLGWWSASQVMRPVSTLARYLQTYHDKDNPPKPLAPRFADDEVGQLAAALDDYSARLTEMVERDRDFNADVSHELRTPLTVIRGATELLLTTPQLEPKTRQRLLRIARAGQQCSDLIGALLLLSRNERGSGHTPIAKVAEQLLIAHRTQMGNKSLQLHLDIAHEPVVQAPEAVVAVALGNLIGNAVKYTRQGWVRVQVNEDRVEVSDTGPGLSIEDAQHLFQRGYRGTHAGRSQGGGIGLSIVHRLCVLYDWHVRIVPGQSGGVVASLHFYPPPESE